MTSAQDHEDPVLTSTEVAAMFGVTVHAVSVWAKAGRIPSFQTPGGHYRFRRSEIEAMRQTSQAEPEAATA